MNDIPFTKAEIKLIKDARQDVSGAIDAMKALDFSIEKEVLHVQGVLLLGVIDDLLASPV